MELLQYLKANQELLTIAQLEKAVRIGKAKMPPTTLARYIRTGYLPKKWKKPTQELIEKNLMLKEFANAPAN